MQAIRSFGPSSSEFYPVLPLLFNGRTSKFLRFVVEQELSGLGGQVKESVVSVEAFGRPPNYDVLRDSVVRTEAAKLRDRLAAFYTSDDARETWCIELPKGGYRPVFRRRDPVASALSQRPLVRRHIRLIVVALCGIAVLPWLYGDFPIAIPGFLSPFSLC